LKMTPGVPLARHLSHQHRPIGVHQDSSDRPQGCSHGRPLSRPLLYKHRPIRVHQNPLR
ncbi:Mrna Export Factor, partial [Manis pentadactyla]